MSVNARIKAPRATESQCQHAIVQAAILCGWLVHAERPAQGARGEWRTNLQGHPGLPDLILVRGGRLMFVELKRRPNKLEADQLEWKRELERVSAGVGWGAGIGAEVSYRVLWVPEEMPAFLEELR